MINILSLLEPPKIEFSLTVIFTFQLRHHIPSFFLDRNTWPAGLRRLHFPCPIRISVSLTVSLLAMKGNDRATTSITKKSTSLSIQSSSNIFKTSSEVECNSWFVAQVATGIDKSQDWQLAD